MNIADKRPKDVMKSEFIQQYEEFHEDIWHRLVEINTTITILETIQKFPFNYFYPPQENVFWTTVYWNFIYVIIVLMHALVKDQVPDTHTLPKFKNKIVNEWLKSSEKAEYLKKLQKAKFDHITKNILEKTADIRHQLLAHRIIDPDGHLSDPHSVKVSEIRRTYDATEELFRSCSFGAEYECTLYPKEFYGGKPIERDIDHLLDLIVKDSYWLNEPELRKEFWTDRRRSRSHEELSELNEFRKKFGMPEV